MAGAKKNIIVGWSAKRRIGKRVAIKRGAGRIGSMQPM